MVAIAFASLTHEKCIYIYFSTLTYQVSPLISESINNRTYARTTYLRHNDPNLTVYVLSDTLRTRQNRTLTQTLVFR